MSFWCTAPGIYCLCITQAACEEDPNLRSTEAVQNVEKFVVAYYQEMQALEAIIGPRRKTKACIYLGNAGGQRGAKRRSRADEYERKVGMATRATPATHGLSEAPEIPPDC